MVSNVTITGLTKRFGDTVAVDDLDIEVNEGEVVGLLGPSGCGKTTTLRSICGLERIDEGEISIGDKVVASSENDVHLPPYDRDIGMMFQSNALWPHMDVRQNVLYPLNNKRASLTPDEKQQKLDEVLSIVDLEGFADRAVTELSGGQQQRIALARSLVHEPDVLLMDEPLSSLDARLQRSMRAEIRSIQQQQKFTTIYVTHDQREAMYMADRIYLMRDGEIIESGEVEQIYRHPTTAFSMRFFDPNDPMEGEVVDVDDRFVTVDIGGHARALKVRRNGLDISPGDTCELFVRPDDVHVARDDDEENSIDAKVNLCAFQGSEYEVKFQVGDFEILGNVPDAFDIGATVRITLPPEDLRCFPLGY